MLCSKNTYSYILIRYKDIRTDAGEDSSDGMLETHFTLYHEISFTKGEGG